MPAEVPCAAPCMHDLVNTNQEESLMLHAGDPTRKLVGCCVSLAKEADLKERRALVSVAAASAAAAAYTTSKAQAVLSAPAALLSCCCMASLQ